MVNLEIAPMFCAAPIRPPLANRWILIDDNGVLCRPDVTDNATVAGERNDQDPVTRNEVDESLVDSSSGFAAWVAAHT
jgi:hypothetical protein